RREDRPEVTLPPRKRLDIALGPRDRRAHAYTRQLMKTEMSEIRELQAAERKRQTVISELLRIDHRRSTEISDLRTALQGHGQQGLAGDHTQSDLPEEAGGSA
nr:hypothetical protein [Tanacetum cinerariifolium]